MEAAIFVGLQASGKSTFFRERFSRTHVRISLDLMKTRHREKRFLEVCIETGQRFAIDNTNPSAAERAQYILAAKAAGYWVACYFFESRIEDCKRRNAARPTEEQIPVVGLLGTRSRLEIPKRSEGFDEMWFVRIADGRGFAVAEWNDEV